MRRTAWSRWTVRNRRTEKCSVKMSTVGINPLDNTFRSGHIYLATPANVPRVGGQTGAGVVVESRHPAHQAGDRVFVGAMGWGLVTDGTWREYVAAPAPAVSPISQLTSMTTSLPRQRRRRAPSVRLARRRCRRIGDG